MSGRDLLPLWATGVLVAAALLASLEVGVWLGRRGHARRVPPDGPHEAPRGDGDGDAKEVLSAALGLLALLVGFTFAMALGRFEARRALVLDEAKAIRAAWLRAALADDAVRAPLARALHGYVEARLAVAAAGEDAAAIAAAEARTDSLQRTLWAATAEGVRRDAAGAGGLLVPAVGALFDVTADRRAALASRLPLSVLLALATYALAAAAILGYVTGQDATRGRRPPQLFLLLLALALTLVLDLDRPRAGSIVVSQAPLRAVRAELMAAIGPIAP